MHADFYDGFGNFFIGFNFNKIIKIYFEFSNVTEQKFDKNGIYVLTCAYIAQSQVAIKLIIQGEISFFSKIILLGKFKLTLRFIYYLLFVDLCIEDM